MRYCPLCGDPVGIDGSCDCGSDHYLSKASIEYLDFDDFLCALHDNVVEKELSRK